MPLWMRIRYQYMLNKKYPQLCKTITQMHKTVTLSLPMRHFPHSHGWTCIMDLIFMRLAGSERDSWVRQANARHSRHLKFSSLLSIFHRSLSVLLDTFESRNFHSNYSTLKSKNKWKHSCININLIYSSWFYKRSKNFRKIHQLWKRLPPYKNGHLGNKKWV